MEIKTSCEGCVFLKKNLCQLGRHENFANNGATIELVDNSPVINGRFCSAKRGTDWLVDGEYTSTRIVRMRSEILVGTHVFIYTDKWSWLAIEKTCISLRKQVLRPSGITITGPQDTFKEKFLNRIAKLGTVRVSIDPLYNKFQCVDMSIDNCKSYFYILIDAGATLNRNFLSNIDDQINDELTQFNFITGEDRFSYGCSIDLHKELNGNKPGYLNVGGKEILFATSSLETKVKYLAKEQNREGFIKKYSDFLYGN